MKLLKCHCGAIESQVNIPDNLEKIVMQLKKTQLIINNFKTKNPSSLQAGSALNKLLNL